MALSYRMYDADNHLYESADAFTRHLPAHRSRDFFWVTDDRGHRHIIVNGRLWDYLPNPTFDPIAVAGCLLDVFTREKSMLEAKNSAYTFEPLSSRPEYQDRDRRIERLDEQGIEVALLFPTLVSGLEEATGDNVDLTVDLLWSFNRWLDEDWGFAHQGRLYATPVISLADLDAAVAMLDWALDRGGRAIMLRPSPVPTRMVTAMVVQGAVTRHPRLRLVSVENGSDWVAWLVERFEVEYSRYPGSFPEDPMEAFERCVWVVPYWEEPIHDLAELVPVERILAGSDFPHSDGLPEPKQFAKALTEFRDDEVRLIMRENLQSILAAP